VKKPHNPARKHPTKVDRVIGRRIRAERVAAEVTQTELAGAIGLSFQQLQKYENGTNRVTAAKLFEICQILDVPIASMYQE
jgi:transcriptional regulator with XRE-family HTH domain